MKNKNNSLDFLSKCSYCGGDFRMDDLTVLEENEQKTTLHVTCSRCRTSAIFFVSNNQAGIISLGMVTDLDKKEVKHKFSRSAVSADEVIDAHQFVSGRNGSLLELAEEV